MRAVYHVSANIGGEWRHYDTENEKDLMDDVRSYQVNAIPYIIAKEVRD